MNGPADPGHRLFEALSAVISRRDWALRLWDGRSYGERNAPAFTITLSDRRCLDRLIGAHPERGFGRAYVDGYIDIEPLEPFLDASTTVPPRKILAAAPSLLRAALALGARPDWHPVRIAEARLRGRRHSRARDAEAVRHHYDLPAEFFRLFLDESMTYTCAYFENGDDTLAQAQRAKLDLVCRKLRLQPGETLLDIGCGWGSLAIHAAREYAVHVVGVTLSAAQVDVARDRVRDEGLADRVEIRLADYRDPLRRTFDAVASVGMIEQVGREKMAEFGEVVHRALRPGGRALIHGITTLPHLRWSRTGFTNVFVFPDGELQDIGFVHQALEAAGLELRDDENLREHYARTTRMWVHRLEDHWDEAVRLAGRGRARVWRLYMIGASVGFGNGSLSLHQSLVVRRFADGGSGLPLTRNDWLHGPGAART